MAWRAVLICWQRFPTTGVGRVFSAVSRIHTMMIRLCGACLRQCGGSERRGAGPATTGLHAVPKIRSGLLHDRDIRLRWVSEADLIARIRSVDWLVPKYASNENNPRTRARCSRHPPRAASVRVGVLYGASHPSSGKFDSRWLRETSPCRLPCPRPPRAPSLFVTPTATYAATIAVDMLLGMPFWCVCPFLSVCPLQAV